MRKYDSETKLSMKELKKSFDELNNTKNRNFLDRLNFCWHAMASDSDESIELVLFFIEQGDENFQAELINQFQFKKDKFRIYTFLQKKLQITMCETRIGHIEQILEIINYKPLEYYKNWLEDLKSNKRSDNYDFIWELIKTSYVEFHYNLLMDEELTKEFRISLGSRFNEYGEKGNELLLKNLEGNNDEHHQGYILSLLKEKSLSNKSRIKVLSHARALIKSEDEYTREQAIIRIGMIGGLKELEILKNRLLNDTHSKCRAWASSSFMQIWFRKKSDKLRLFVLSSIQEVLREEEDYFAISVYIETLREIEDNKFRISQKSLDNIDKAKIDIAKRRIKKYLSKIL